MRLHSYYVPQTQTNIGDLEWRQGGGKLAEDSAKPRLFRIWLDNHMISDFGHVT